MHGSGRKQEGAVEFIDNYINRSNTSTIVKFIHVYQNINGMDFIINLRREKKNY